MINKRKDKNMNEETYVKEIARVKKLKRAVEAEVELLRSDMEQGILHFRVNSDRVFRKKLAEAICLINSPSYSRKAYADPVEGRIYWEKSWAESIGFRVIPVQDFFPQDTDFSDGDVDFAMSQVLDEVVVV